MKIVTFGGSRIGVLRGEVVMDITEAVAARTGLPFPWSVNALCALLTTNLDWVAAVADKAAGLRLADLVLGAPVPAPTHLFAAPANFRAHIEEMKGTAMASNAGSAANLGFFTKASGSVSGPSQAIELPANSDRRFDHEGEIAIVIGKAAQGVSREEALSCIAGFTLVIDVTMRMTETKREERTYRKSFATFSPMGPCLVTADEIGDMDSLGVKLWVNGELRQDSSASDLIVDIPELVSRASHVLPLQPGDIYITGSPAGVGEIKPGDTVVAAMTGAGEMRLPVINRSW